MTDINPNHYKYMPHGAGEITGDESVTEVMETTDMPEETAGTVTPDEPRIDNDNREDLQPEEKYELKKDKEDSAVFSFVRNNALASIVYNFLSPLLIPTIATLFIFLSSLLSVVVPGAVLPYSLTVFGATFLLPVLTIFVLHKIGIVQSLRLYDRSDRLVPYVIEFLALGAMAIFFIIKGGAPWIWTIFCGGAAIALVNFVINFRIRISNHCSAIAALLATIIVIQMYGLPQKSLFYWAIGISLFTGITGTLSIIKGKHTLWEVMLGYATGFLCIILFSLIHS